MITLAAADTLAGVAASATTVNCAIFGLEIAAGVETYKCLYQGQLAAAAATLYTVPASTATLVRSIHVVNTNASATKTFQLFRGGTAGSNAITASITLPAGGMAIYEGDGWVVLSASGEVVQTFSHDHSTAASGVSLSPTNVYLPAASAALPSLAAAGDVNTGLWFPAADTIAASTAGVERMRIDSSGRVGIGVTPADANAILELAKGINFPATQVASSNANTLDDYEEGTWTPVVTFATPGNVSPTYAFRNGTYIKLGRAVFYVCSIYVTSLSHSTASGALKVTGLPFTEGAGHYTGSGGFTAGWTKTGSPTMAVRVPPNAAYLEVQSIVSGSIDSPTTVTEWPTGSVLSIEATGYYMV